MQARQIFSESRCDFRNFGIKTSFLPLIYVVTTNELKSSVLADARIAHA
jgi:hypothetical protein